MTPSKRWPEFQRFLEALKDHPDNAALEIVVREILTEAMKAAPVDCLLDAGFNLVHFLKRENRDIADMN